MAAGNNSKRKTSAKATKPAKKKATKKAAKTSVKPESSKSSPSKKPAKAKKGATGTSTTVKSLLDSPEFKPIVRDLIRLAKEQEYLTFDDLNEALPDTTGDLELMEELI